MNWWWYRGRVEVPSPLSVEVSRSTRERQADGSPARSQIVSRLRHKPAFSAKGSILLETLRAIHSKMRWQLAAKVDDFDADRSYLHHPEGTITALRAVCDSRKPRPGCFSTRPPNTISTWVDVDDRRHGR